MSSKRKRSGAQQTKPAAPAPAAAVRSDEVVLGWSERGAAAVLSLILIGLHVRVWLHAGELWRDELNSVILVAMPSLGDVWRNLQYDSFPMLWFPILRAWTSLLGESWPAVRGLGLITGLASLAALWWTSRAMTSRAPLVSLVLFAFTSTALICGDSVRAFGFGSVLIILTLGAMWRLVESPTAWRFAAATIAAVASAQCLYQNCVLLFAICLGASAVAAGRRAWKLAAAPLGIGALAAVSMVPYLQAISQVGKWNVIMKVQPPVDLPWLVGKLTEAIHPTGGLFGGYFAWLWLVLAVLSLLASAWRLFRPGAEQSARQRDLAIFVLVTMVAATISYFSFLKVLNYPTQAWYYLALMAVLALLIEAGLGLIASATLWGRIVRLAACLLLAVPAIFFGWSGAGTRQTNMDRLTAELLLQSPTKDDYVVVLPWFFGMSFERYYRGDAPWTTLPEVNAHGLHRYDLFKEKMSQSDPIKPILVKMCEALQSGHRVWLVGWPQFLRPGEAAGNLPPAPNSPYGWSEGAYSGVWLRQAASVLQSHATKSRQIEVPADGPINPFETAFLIEFEGWRP